MSSQKVFRKIAKRGGKIAGTARKQIEKQSGKRVVSPLSAKELGRIEEK